MKNTLSKLNLQTKRIAAIIANAIELKELFVITGLAAVGYGIAQIFPPAAWIVVGAAVFLIGMRL